MIVACPRFRNDNITPGTEATHRGSPGLQFSVNVNPDVLTLLSELLSNHHLFFAGVLKMWQTGWRERPNITQAMTPHTTVSPLRWFFDSGLIPKPTLCDLIAERCGVEVLKICSRQRVRVVRHRVLPCRRPRRTQHDPVGTR